MTGHPPYRLTRLGRRRAAELVGQLPDASQALLSDAGWRPDRAVELDGAPVAVARVGLEGMANAAVLAYLDRQPLRVAERAALAVVAAALDDADADATLSLYLLPEDGWVLPTLHTLGMSIDRGGRLPPRRVARLTVHRWVAEALCREGVA